MTTLTNPALIQFRYHVMGPGAEISAPYAGPPIRWIGEFVANAGPPIRWVGEFVANAGPPIRWVGEFVANAGPPIRWVGEFVANAGPPMRVAWFSAIAGHPNCACTSSHVHDDCIDARIRIFRYI